MYLSLWNSCRRRYSDRWARLPLIVAFQRLPAMFVSCLVSGNSCSLNISRCTSCASFSVCFARFTKCSPVLHHSGTSTGSISSLSVLSCVLAISVSPYDVCLLIMSFASANVSQRRRPSRACWRAQSFPLPKCDLEGSRVLRRRPIFDHMLTLSSTHRLRRTSMSCPHPLCETMTSGSQVPSWAKRRERRARSFGLLTRSANLSRHSLSMSRGNWAMTPFVSKFTGRTSVICVMWAVVSSDPDSSMTRPWHMAETHATSSLWERGFTTVLNLRVTVDTGGGGGTASGATDSSFLTILGPSTQHSHLHQLIFPPPTGLTPYSLIQLGPMIPLFSKKFSMTGAPDPRIFSNVVPPSAQTLRSGTG
mmetsp:Transcript_16776/g.38952  ORF Transcript_16776/g.38952 Transcript_16776/m.38952 type:complete len:363 (-) Transcript_16776:517-1605(-)